MGKSWFSNRKVSKEGAFFENTRVDVQEIKFLKVIYENSDFIEYK